MCAHSAGSAKIPGPIIAPIPIITAMNSPMLLVNSTRSDIVDVGQYRAHRVRRATRGLTNRPCRALIEPDRGQLRRIESAAVLAITVLTGLAISRGAAPTGCDGVEFLSFSRGKTKKLNSVPSRRPPSRRPQSPLPSRPLDGFKATIVKPYDLDAITRFVSELDVDSNAE
jgi:hypothetical protein